MHMAVPLVSESFASLVQASPKAAISAALPASPKAAISDLLRASGRMHATSAPAANVVAEPRLSATTAADPILAAAALIRSHAVSQTVLAGSVLVGTVGKVAVVKLEVAVG